MREGCNATPNYTRFANTRHNTTWNATMHERCSPTSHASPLRYSNLAVDLPAPGPCTTQPFHLERREGCQSPRRRCRSSRFHRLAQAETPLRMMLPFVPLSHLHAISKSLVTEKLPTGATSERSCPERVRCVVGVAGSKAGIGTWGGAIVGGRS